MTHASRSNMALPYPYELELGLMKVFGSALHAAAPPGATATAKQFSDSLSARFHAWRPDADAATWQLFESRARAEMAGLQRETRRCCVSWCSPCPTSELKAASEARPPACYHWMRNEGHQPF
jgi:hypothetical protein